MNLRPYYAEGSKTVGYEIVEQLGWSLPDRVVCPVASGSLFTRIGRAFDEWRELGLVEGGRPVFNGAQPQGCSPVATAFSEGWDICKPQRPDTIAKSLAIGDPADGPYALELARRGPGAIDAVDDDEIRAGIRLLAETTGIFTETAGGVTVATLRKLAERGDIVRVSDDVAFIKSAFDSAVAMVKEIVGINGSVTVAQLRDRMGASRRPVLALLEYLDALRVTRRVGDARLLR